MAKQPTNTNQDPAALAFSAVEDALKDSVFTTIDDDDRKAAGKDKPKARGRESAKPDKSERARSAEKIAAQTASFANDDRAAASRLLFGLQKRASPVPLLIATALSVVWVVIAALAGWHRYGASIIDPAAAGSFYGSLEFVSLLAITFVPVLGFFGVAILIRRAQDLRAAATAMTQAAMRLTEPEAAAADRVASVGQAVRREVNALGDGLERALSRAGELEVMVHNEVTALERTYSENENRLRSLINELSDQRSSVITNADRVREAIGEAHTLMVSDLDRIGENLSGTISERGETVRKAIEGAATDLDDSLEKRSSKFVSDVDNRTADMLAAIEEGSNRLTSAIDDRTGGIDELFSTRANALTSSVDARINDLATALDTHAGAISDVLADRTSAISASITSGSKAMITNLEERGYAMSGALEAIGTRIAGDIGERSRQSEEALSGITNRLDETMSIRVNAIESRFQTALLEIGGLFEDGTETARQTIANAGAESLSALSARVDEVSVVLDNRIKVMDAVVGDKGESLINVLDGHAADFTNRTNLLETALAEKTAALTGQLETHTDQLSEAIAARTREFDETLSTRTRRLSETLANETQNFAATVDTRTAGLSEAMSARTGELSGQIDGHGEALEKRLTSVVQTVNAAMIGQVNSLSELVSTKITEVNANIGGEIDTAVERLADAETGVTARLDTAADRISASARNAAETIEFGVEHARASITEMVDKRLGTLPEAITARAEIAADRLTELNQNLSASIGQTMTELEQGADRIEETISERVSKVTATISGDVEQTAARMDVAVRTALDQVKQAARHIEDLVEVRAVETAEQLGEKVAEMHRAVASQSETFANLIDAKSAALNASLQDHGNLLRQALDTSSAEAEDFVAASTGRMLDNVNMALNKLNDSNLMLQRVLETTTGNLSQIEGDIAGHTASYAATVKRALGETEEAGRMVGDHVDAFQTSISAMVAQFGSLLSELDAQTSNIDKAASGLQDAGNFSIDTLDNRRNAMEALAESFTSRADDIDARMRAFAESIADTMNDTESRLATARQAMEASLAATGEAVSDRLQSFTASADSQGRQAADVLKNAQQAMLTEIETALADATRRFEDTASAMRSTAGQVSQELEATRSELQRGVVELPEETRASAAAMRRVVAEQIEALNELNNIVRAQSGTHDVSARRPAPSAEPRQPQAYRPAPEPRQPDTGYRPAPEPRQPDTGHREPIEPRRPSNYLTPDADEDDEFDLRADTGLSQPRRPHFESRNILEEVRTHETPRAAARVEPPRQEMPRQEAPRQETLRQEMPRQETPRQEAPRAPAPRAPASSDSGSWLRDVLRNASASQQAGAQQRGINLSSLTGEIARAIDSNALAEAWQRYQAGESNVFSRRLYTLPGQGTYDEVRKKLQRDSEFATTATAYMDEFEHMLQEAARSRQPASETRTLLNSDRGKVYAMLAHANGRLA